MDVTSLTSMRPWQEPKPGKNFSVAKASHVESVLCGTTEVAPFQKLSFASGSMRG
jgi:hypothetical protein